jgi:hypothetical protein
MVTRELTKMFDHLLEPLGVRQVPESIGEAISAYTAARDHHADELGVTIELSLQSEVIEALRISAFHHRLTYGVETFDPGGIFGHRGGPDHLVTRRHPKCSALGDRI